MLSGISARMSLRANTERDLRYSIPIRNLHSLELTMTQQYVSAITMNIIYLVLTFLLILLIFWVLGRSRIYEIQIDGHNSSLTPPGNCFTILPGNGEINKMNPEFQEFSKYIIIALEKKGYKKIDDTDNCQILVFLNYGFGDPQHIINSYSIPKYGQIDGETSFFSGTTYGTNKTTSETITTLPSYVQTGLKNFLERNAIYNRFLTLEGIDLTEFRRTGQIVQLFKTIVTSSGRSDNLGRVFPIMVGGSSEYIGTNTGKQISVTIGENDIRLTSIKNMR
jgi:hypothetical protein